MLCTEACKPGGKARDEQRDGGECASGAREVTTVVVRVDEGCFWAWGVRMGKVMNRTILVRFRCFGNEGRRGCLEGTQFGFHLAACERLNIPASCEFIFNDLRSLYIHGAVLSSSNTQASLAYASLHRDTPGPHTLLSCYLSTCASRGDRRRSTPWDLPVKADWKAVQHDDPSLLVPSG